MSFFLIRHTSVASGKNPFTVFRFELKHSNVNLEVGETTKSLAYANGRWLYSDGLQGSTATQSPRQQMTGGHRLAKHFAVCPSTRGWK